MRRCFVIACRVSFDPAVNCEIDEGRPPESVATMDSRVSSPNAANTGACARDFAAARLRLLRDIPLDALHLLCPAAVIRAECRGSPLGRDFVESGFREPKQSRSEE